MKHALFILSLFFCCALQAQKKQDLQKYYSNVWQAEQYLLEENYKKAADHYKDAFKHKKWAFDRDYYNAKYSCEMAKVKDTFWKKKYGGMNEKAMKIIREIHSDDQRVRQNDTIYDKNLQTDTIALERIHREMDIQDSLNIIRFKELMKSINVFDESVVNYDEIGIFFNHWFLHDSTLQDYFLPIALEAVHAGTFNPLNYVNMASIRAWRMGGEGTISDYGMNYLTIYRKDTDEYCNDTCTFLAFSYNQGNSEWLERVNKNRAEIYLENVKKQTIRDFLLWERNLREKGGIRATAQFICVMPQEVFQQFVERVKANPNINYFLTGERSFD